jgi:hypothetical protein
MGAARSNGRPLDRLTTPPLTLTFAAEGLTAITP